jgi:hypothetical protein
LLGCGNPEYVIGVFDILYFLYWKLELKLLDLKFIGEPIGLEFILICCGEVG